MVTQSNELTESEEMSEWFDSVDNTESLTENELTMLRSITSRGFAAVVFEPGEIGDCDPQDIESAMIEAGWRVIQNNP